MKRAKAITALAAVTLTMGAADATLAAEGPATATEAAAVVGREVAAYNAHDAALVTRLHAPTATITLMPSGRVLATGSEGILALFAQNFKAQPDVKLTLRSQSVLRNMVVNRYAVSGGGTSEILSIYDVKNGVIANEWLILG